MSRRVSTQRMSLMKQVVSWFQLAQGSSFQGLRLKLARAGYRSRDAMFIYMFSKLALMGGLAFAGALMMTLTLIAPAVLPAEPGPAAPAPISCGKTGNWKLRVWRDLDSGIDSGSHAGCD